MTERVLLVGASGLLGRALLRHRPVHLDEVLVPTSSEFDLERPESWSGYLSSDRVDRVILSAAWTQVDDCQADPERAYRLNGIVPGQIARLCAAEGLPLTFLSTDYVFDGAAAPHPYHETALASPLSVYAASKWSGECEIRESGAKFHIMRSSGLYGAGGADFVLAIMARLEAGLPVQVVDDQVLSPTWVDALAPRVWQLALSNHFGTFHLASAGMVSWFEFARRLARELGFPDSTVEPTTSQAFGRPAPRPAFSALSSAKYRQYFDDTLPGWDESLEARVREIESGVR